MELRVKIKVHWTGRGPCLLRGVFTTDSIYYTRIAVNTTPFPAGGVGPRQQSPLAANSVVLTGI
jgi:hypothetical protein